MVFHDRGFTEQLVEGRLLLIGSRQAERVIGVALQGEVLDGVPIGGADPRRLGDWIAATAGPSSCAAPVV
jgi:hypothetical protein